MECATLLRDIRFGMRFFGEKGRKFFFYSWLVSYNIKKRFSWTGMMYEQFMGDFTSLRD